MANQPGLIDDPLRDGLFRQYLDGDHVEHGKWMRAHAEGSAVGVCRSCGGRMHPTRPYEHGQTTWYEARCAGCGKEIAAPARRTDAGGRVLRRSSRHSEMPGGWWEHRDAYLREGGA